jgi:hypothetical protein
MTRDLSQSKLFTDEAGGAKRWIISASRRTDLPAFQADWFMERLRAGYVEANNPFNNTLYHVSLKSEEVHSFVFWSKDYRPLLPHLDELDRRDYRLSFHFTITGLPRKFEPRVPETEIALETLAALSRRYSPNHINWRFDPIAFSDELQEEYTLKRFARLASLLRGKVQRCNISFIGFYAKVEKRLRQMGCFDPPPERKQALTAQLAKIAADNDMQLLSCYNSETLPGVKKGHCIDGRLLKQLSPDRPLSLRMSPTRPTCGCNANRDIGAYGVFRHGCVYCYANPGRGRAD